jgi:molybdenum cofactor synthesis domain-containing protein
LFHFLFFALVLPARTGAGYDGDMNATTAAILVIGDEILSGKVEDQNARLLIGELRSLGVALRRVLIIPDDVETVAAAVHELSSNFDHVFTSGGVGPTHDDVTISGVARAFNKPIVRHPDLEQRLKSHFGQNADDSKLRMADVPEGAELLEMPDWRWPVLVCGNVYILPGVPELFRKKFLAMRERFRVEPFFTKAIYTLEDEFDIAEDLRAIAEANPLVAIGSYPNFSSPEYKVKLTLESKDGEALTEAVEALLTKLDPKQLVRSE